MIEYRVEDEIPESLGGDDWGLYDGEQVLIRYEDGEPVRIIFVDGHEPEDMYLFRDLTAFVSELNRLAKEVNSGN